MESGFHGDFEPAFDRSYVYILASIGLFILGIASINFVNLSTARSSNRAKEVGMRKVMGSLRGYIVKQFLIESVVLSSLAVLIAIVLSWLLLPIFNSVSGRQLELPWGEPYFYLITIVGTVGLGIVAGLYPSVYLSAFKPRTSIEGHCRFGRSRWQHSKCAGGSTIVVTIFLVIGTIVLFRQLDFINNKNLGYDREQIVIVGETYLLRNQKEAYKDEALKNTIFTHGTTSGFLPAAGPWRLPRSWWRGNEKTAAITAQDWGIDAGYFETLGMNIKYGRNFLNGTQADSTAVLINESSHENIRV